MAGMTIDQYDLSVFNQYAIRTMMNEQINQQLRLREAASIPPQIQIVDIHPRMSEFEMLLGGVQMYNPWAYFFPPKRFRTSRRSPFSFSRVVPSFGSVLRHDEELALLDTIPCYTSEEKEEKEAIKEVLKKLKTINNWMGFIVGRMGQFLQG